MERKKKWTYQLSRPGAALVPPWCRPGAALVPLWCRSGAALVPLWSRSGPALVPTWCRSGAALVPLWSHPGADLVPLCCRPGADHLLTSTMIVPEPVAKEASDQDMEGYEAMEAQFHFGFKEDSSNESLPRFSID